MGHQSKQNNANMLHGACLHCFVGIIVLPKVVYSNELALIFILVLC
jgi:hypothetical protein